MCNELGDRQRLQELPQQRAQLRSQAPLRSRLDPIDLYVRHTSPLLNALLARMPPLLEPTRIDPILRRFPNYNEVWARE